MFRIRRKETLTPGGVHLFEIEAPLVARKAQPGQFVILRLEETGERIPITIADFDPEKGTVTVVVMEVGKTTRQMATLKEGDFIANFLGPLGNPTPLEKYEGTVVCVAGGFAVAVIAPIARALKEMGNKVITIMGARSKDLLFWEDHMRAVSDQLIVATDDGSYGRKGLVTEPLKEILDSGEKIAVVYAIGPTLMMKFASRTTQPYGVKTWVSLNPIMIDGTGMCGGCRVSVGGETKFTCVDGPDFDGHQVDWDLLLTRQRIYVPEERQALERWHQCRVEKQGVESHART